MNTPESPRLRQQGFQEIDIVAMTRPVTKYAVQIREDEDIVKELNKAWHIANTGRKGPVLIDLPMNIQRGDVKNPVYEMSLENINLGDVNSEKLEMERAGPDGYALRKNRIKGIWGENRKFRNCRDCVI